MRGRVAESILALMVVGRGGSLFEAWNPNSGWWAICAAGLLLSCNLAEGLEDVGSSLGNPDAALIDAPGRLLRAGRFSNLLVDGSFSDGGHVIALEQHAENATRAVVLPYPEGEGCVVAPALDFNRLSSRIDVELPGLFAVQTTADDDGRGDVLITNFDCETQYELKRSYLPRTLFPAIGPRGILSLEDQNQLSLIVPGEEGVTPIADEVSVASTTGDYLWAAQDGRLVVWDRNLTEVARLGDGLQLYVPTGGRRLTAAYLDREGLWVWSEEDGSRLISETACSPAFLGSDTLAYLDPCGEAKLRIHTLGARIGAEAEFVTLDGPSGVTNHGRASVSWGQGSSPSEIIFLLGESDAESGALALATLEDASTLEEGHLSLDFEILVDEGVTLLGQDVFKNYADGVGDLSELERDEEDRIVGVRTLAERVAQLPGGTAYSYRGVLYDFDGRTGTLGVLSPEEGGTRTRILAEQVEVQDQVVEPDTGNFAFVGDFDQEGLGTLYLASEGANEDDRPRALAERVYKNTARFLSQPRGVAYLARPEGEESAALRVWLIESELTVNVQSRVAEYRTVPWPSPGILYSVIGGDDEGLWYAKAR